MTIGQTIAAERRKLGLSQEQLGEKMGVTRQSISKWETNRSVPDLDKLVKLSGVFGVTLDELVLGERPAPAPAPYFSRSARYSSSVIGDGRLWPVRS